MTKDPVLSLAVMLLIVGIGAVPVLAQVDAGYGSPSGRPLNVLFILADQWRSTAFSGCGDPVVKTPM